MTHQIMEIERYGNVIVARIDYVVDLKNNHLMSIFFLLCSYVSCLFICFAFIYLFVFVLFFHCLPLNLFTASLQSKKQHTFPFYLFFLIFSVPRLLLLFFPFLIFHTNVEMIYTRGRVEM